VTGDLLPAAVLPRLATRRLGRAYELMPTCASTNDEIAARAAGHDKEGLLVAAEQQTGGRGRRGRLWHSPAGENLYCSLLLRPSISARLATPLTLLAGAALAQALAALGFAVRLKWPNDVLLDTREGWRKVAGILTEMTSEGEHVRHVVLGVGVNVNGQEFPEPLVPVATSLRLVCGVTVDRGAVLAGFLNAFEPIYDRFLAVGPIGGLAEWSRHAVLGQRCWVSRDRGRFEGVAVGVDDMGALLLRSADGETTAVHAGEVNWLPPP